ncbi:hypothetical protein JCM3765_002769 [Sporobolomyces pararoseus]
MPVDCDYCNKTVADQARYDIHLRSYHLITDTVKGSRLQCENCGCTWYHSQFRTSHDRVCSMPDGKAREGWVWVEELHRAVRQSKLAEDGDVNVVPPTIFDLPAPVLPTLLRSQPPPAVSRDQLVSGPLQRKQWEIPPTTRQQTARRKFASRPPKRPKSNAESQTVSPRRVKPGASAEPELPPKRRIVRPSEKYTVTDQGKWRCLRCTPQVLSPTQAAAACHWSRFHRLERYPCIYCCAELPGENRAKHLEQFHAWRDDGRKICRDCPNTWMVPGSEGEVQHRLHCVRPNGILRDGWKETTANRVVRKKTSDAQPRGSQEAPPQRPLAINNPLMNHPPSILTEEQFQQLYDYTHHPTHSPARSPLAPAHPEPRYIDPRLLEQYPETDDRHKSRSLTKIQPVFLSLRQALRYPDLL